MPFSKHRFPSRSVCRSLVGEGQIRSALRIGGLRCGRLRNLVSARAFRSYKKIIEPGIVA